MPTIMDHAPNTMKTRETMQDAVTKYTPELEFLIRLAPPAIPTKEFVIKMVGR